LQILAGLDLHGVDPCADHRLHLCLVGVAQRSCFDMAQGGQLGAGADGAEDEAGLAGRRKLVGRLAGDAGRGAAELESARAEVVFAQRDGRGAEAVGFHGIAARGEVGAVDIADDIGRGDAEQLVAALLALPGGGGDGTGLYLGAHGAVHHENALQNLFQ